MGAVVGKVIRGLCRHHISTRALLSAAGAKDGWAPLHDSSGAIFSRSVIVQSSDRELDKRQVSSKLDRISSRI